VCVSCVTLRHTHTYIYENMRGVQQDGVAGPDETKYILQFMFFVDTLKMYMYIQSQFSKYRRRTSTMNVRRLCTCKMYPTNCTQFMYRNNVQKHCTYNMYINIVHKQCTFRLTKKNVHTTCIPIKMYILHGYKKCTFTMHT
jgi:hypothetical protein